jgi:hypothetical protein
MRVKLLRALCFGGVRKEPGTELDLADPHLVREMLWTGKAEAVGDKPAAPSGPLTTDSASTLVKGKARKGANDAGQ